MSEAGTEVVSIVKRFDSAERVLSFEQGRLDVIMVGGRAIGKGSYAPGWRWSRVAQAGAGRRGLPEHVGVVLSGRAKVRIQGGSEVDLMPGDFFHITTEEDAWVVGYRPCEILYLSGVEALIQQLHRQE
jgi:hypothetical protein